MKLRLPDIYPKTSLFCFGCFAALGMAPVYWWIFTAAAYGVLVRYLLKTVSSGQAGLYGFIFFFGFFLTGLYWTSASLFVDLKTWWWALPFSFVGLPVLLSLFPAFVLVIAGCAKRYRLAAFMLALVLADLGRSFLLSGFPWNLPLHGLVNNPIILAVIPYTGFFALNAGITLLFSGLYIFPRFLGIVLGILVLGGFLTSPATSRAQITDKTIVMVQANIPQQEKWNPAYIPRNIDRYIAMTETALNGMESPALVIWPETALSRNILGYPHFNARIRGMLDNLPQGSYLITGFLDHQDDAYFNALAVFNRNGDIVSSYDKHHLVPFGEYMPFGLGTITGFDGFSAGTPPAPVTIGQDVSFLPLICYEVIFPSYSRPASGADFILNITNDAWFGYTAGPYQHFDHARFRAAQARKPLLRLSGNGISAVIAADGRPIIRTFLNTSDTIVFENVLK